jgi:hypothetical protein
VSHWPPQSGYFAPSAARPAPAVTANAAATANAQLELRYDMIGLPQSSKSLLQRACLIATRLSVSPPRYTGGRAHGMTARSEPDIADSGAAHL